MNNTILIPSKGAESWKDFLAKPKIHWKTGHSAKALAYSWESQKGFPQNVKTTLEKSGLDLEMIFAIPEYKIELDTHIAPSQNDLFVLAKNKKELVVITVEGKVEEAFDEVIRKWYKEQGGKKDRLTFLLNKLELAVSKSQLDSYRYQLFHRTVSAILMAEKVFAKKAIMLVHSFSQDNKWFDDFRNFLLLLNPKNQTPAINQVYQCKTLQSGIELYIGWVKGDEKYLKI